MLRGTILMSAAGWRGLKAVVIGRQQLPCDSYREIWRIKYWSIDVETSPLYIADTRVHQFQPTSTTACVFAWKSSTRLQGKRRGTKTILFFGRAMEIFSCGKVKSQSPAKRITCLGDLETLWERVWVKLSLFLSIFCYFLHGKYYSLFIIVLSKYSPTVCFILYNVHIQLTNPLWFVVILIMLNNLVLCTKTYGA